MQIKSIHYNPEIIDINSKNKRLVELPEGALTKKNISVEVIEKDNSEVFAMQICFQW